MPKKFLLTGSVLLSLGTFGSYVLGAIRDIIFGNFFGVSGMTDAYLSSFLLGDILLMIFISSALMGLVTPIYLREKEISKTKAQKIFGDFFSTLLLIFGMVLIGASIFAESIFPLISPEIYSNYPKEFIQMGRLFLLSNGIFALSNFFGTFVMAHKHFVSTAIAPILYNLGIIGGILLLHEEYGVLAASYGGVVGALLHMVSRGGEYWYFSRKKSECFTIENPLAIHKKLASPAVQELIISMLWKMGGLIIVPLTFLLFVRISAEQEGLYTAFQYLRNLQSAPVAIFGIAFATAIFPILSQNQAEENQEKFHQNFWKTFSHILFWTLPASIGIFFLGDQVLAFLYGIEKTSLAYGWVEILSIFLAGILVFEALFHLFSRSFYASKDVSSPLIGGIIFLGGAVITLFIGKIFFPERLVYFLGGAYFIGYFFQTLFLFFWGIHKEIFIFSIPQNLQKKIISTGIWSCIMGVFLFFTSLFPEIFWRFSFDIINVIIISSIAIGIYFLPFLWKQLRK
jgi:putative peptidoglycan lipid II flippase